MSSTTNLLYRRQSTDQIIKFIARRNSGVAACRPRLRLAPAIGARGGLQLGLTRYANPKTVSGFAYLFTMSINLKQLWNNFRFVLFQFHFTSASRLT